MVYNIEYKSSVTRDLKKLNKNTILRILESIEKELGSNRDAGVPLTGQFKGLYKYRIGNYRVIYTKTAEGILVLRIGHRSKVYR